LIDWLSGSLSVLLVLQVTREFCSGFLQYFALSRADVHDAMCHVTRDVTWDWLGGGTAEAKSPSHC